MTEIEQLRAEIERLRAANETLESDYYAIKRELSCRDGQIAKMRNHLDDIQNQHEGVSMRLGAGQQMQLNNTMKSLTVSRNGLGPFLCALDGDGLTILFRVSKIVAPVADNPFHNKGGAE